MESTRVCPIQNTSYPRVRDSSSMTPATQTQVAVDIEDRLQTAQQQPDESTILSSVDTLKQALSFPGMKWCLREYFNRDKADQLMKAKGGVLSADHRKALARFLLQGHGGQVVRGVQVRLQHQEEPGLQGARPGQDIWGRHPGRTP